MSEFLSEQIEQREKENPDEVHEVPIESTVLQQEVLPFVRVSRSYLKNANGQKY
jgi:hypothetical protein